MTSHDTELPPRAAEADMILLALFQSRLRERSLYLGEEIRAQRRRLSTHAPSAHATSAHALSAHAPRARPTSEADATLARIERAEQALAAVRQAQERLGRGRYGLCDECQSPIGWDTLLQAPEQTVCAGCSQFADLDGPPLRS